MPTKNQRYLKQLRDVAVALWVIVGAMYLVMAFPDTRAWIQTIDDRVFTMAVDGEVSFWVSVAKTFTFIGSWKVMFPFVMILAVYLYWKKRKMATLFWLSALAVSEILIWATKVIYARPRPPMGLVATNSYSFPSGHTGTAAAVSVGIVLLFALRGSRHWCFWAFAVTYIGAIAWSRVYLRAHWLSDVFTGASLGAAVTISGFLVVVLLVQRGKLSADDGPHVAT
jgi:undecaprenyl-diphosphatase